MRPRQRSSFAALLVLAGLLLVGRTLPAGEPASGRELENTLVDLAERATPRTACVFGALGLGSGAVVDKDGTTVTNAHVGIVARVALLEFADGRRVKARRRGMDLERDLAIYEPVEKLSEPAPCFDLGSERPAPGTWLVALGYPGGPRGDLRPTLSLGQATQGGGLGSPIMGVLRYDDAIRTDIAIFPGNSGGPLLDLSGKLRGINGAMEIGTGAAFAVPIDVVKDRLATLKGGDIRLPGGRILRGDGLLARALERVLDPVIERLVDRVHDGFAPDLHLEGELPKLAKPSTDDLAHRLRECPREKDLAGELHALKVRDLAVRLDDKVLATRVDRRHLVTKASLLGDGKTFQLGHRTARLVATDSTEDLALLELDEEADVALPEDAGSRPPGSLCAAIGPEGLLASGVVSVGPREIPDGVSARIASGGLDGQIVEALRRVEKMLPPLKEAFEPLIAQLEAQESLNAGNEPRGYARVLSHDAPLAPSEAGAPLVDREGRLIGVNVSNANYGTSYAVPIGYVRALFHLESHDARRGKARLY
jgi:S1-C subfamily serine protease